MSLDKFSCQCRVSAQITVTLFVVNISDWQHFATDKLSSTIDALFYPSARYRLLPV